MNETDLLRCLLHVVGRTAISANDVREVVGGGKNRVKAFNLFDGSRTILEVARTKARKKTTEKAARKTTIESTGI